MHKDLLEHRDMKDAPREYDCEEAAAWANGYNSALDALLKLVPNSRKWRGKVIRITPRRGKSVLTARQLGAFLLTAHEDSYIVLDTDQSSVGAADLDSRRGEPCVLLKSA